MLYVFHVDTGTMMTFEMSLALESVACLKRFVEQTCNIPVDKQVLLVSGGESLDERSKVCTYSAGTDTNPIFLFSKSSIESTTPPSASVDYGSDYDFKRKVRDAQDLPATYETVVTRAQLAQQLYDSAKNITRICEGLVHEQHLQQQGWAAVIANLEDLTVEFKRRSEVFDKSFNDYLKEHDNYLKFLQFFNDDLQILAKIPVIPTLLDSYRLENIAEPTESSDEAAKDGEVECSGSDSNKKVQTLLDWISAADSRSTMDQLFEHCSRGLDQFDEKVFKSLCSEVEKSIEASDQSNMKEVKGLGDRLFGLEQLMLEAKRYVGEQADLANSFLQNQNRAGNLGDTSILPDLCDSHRRQLLVMLNNHEQLCDIRRRCTRAKEELSVNLYHRLRWVMYVENRILDVNHKLLVYHDNLKRLRQHLEVLQQIHLAPATYLSAVAEVVRRRAFSQAFLLWASELACHILTIHNEEVTRRKEFQSVFEGHFLNALFPGMDDLPPNFATQAPSIFDSSLPPISNEDIQTLKETLPELTENLTVPDMTTITNFFLAKSIVKTDLDKVDDRGIEEKLVQVVNEVGLASNLDQNLLKPTESETCLAVHGLAHLKDLDKGCESETDTEEFEKVCQSPLDLQFDKELSSPRPGLQDASTLTEVGEKCSLLPPKKPPRTFQKLSASLTNEGHSLQTQRALSTSGSNTESFTNIKNTSLESIDELSSLKNADSCYNSHHQQLQGFNSGHFMRSKSLSPHTPQSPKGEQVLSPNSPLQGHQPSDFVSEEFYIDESLPSSLSIETGNAAQGDYAKQLSNANDVVALLEDNLQTSRTEHDKLKSLITKMALLSRQAIVQLRGELSDLKALYESEKSSIELHYSSLSNSWENLTIEMDNKEKEIIQKITVDHEMELGDYKKLIDVNKEEMKALRVKNLHLETALKRVKEENETLILESGASTSGYLKVIDELKTQLVGSECDRERTVKEVTDRLIREHKVEMENMRTRFRLVAGRSPSDPNLEKIGKSDATHEALVAQLKEAHEADKQKAMENLKRAEAEKWERILADKMEKLKISFSSDKDALIFEVSKRVSEEKDKQIDILREQQAALKLECIKYKNTIQQLTECEIESRSNDELLEKLEVLEKEKCQLETELCMERSRRFEPHEMGASVAVCEGVRVDAATSPVKYKEKLTESQVSLVKSAKLSIETCRPGDAVLVIWDTTHDSYTILQESSFLYFLNTDCLETLGLKKPTSDDKKIFYCTGEVLDKEFCHAKKGENRYRVPKGTKFYRVRVKPLSPMKDIGKSHQSCSQHMSQSQTTAAQSAEQVVTTDNARYSLPSSPTKGHNMDKSMKVTDSSNVETDTKPMTETDSSNKEPDSKSMMETDSSNKEPDTEGR